MRHTMMCLFRVLIISLFAMPLQAEMRTMNDDQMDTVSGQAGISISLDKAAFYDEYARIEIRDSNNTGSLVLNNVVIGSGDGWGYEFSTKDDPLKIDIIEKYGSLTLDQDSILNISAPSWEQKMQISVGGISFCGNPIGSLNIGQIDLNSFLFQLTPPDNDNALDYMDSGIYFRYYFQSRFDSIRYNYNTQATGSLNLQGLRFAERFNGTLTTPSTWASVGSFQIGGDSSETGDGRFAQIELKKDGSALVMDTSLPFQGSVRMEGVTFGGTNMGPVAIDGVQVYKMSVKFNP